MSEINEAKKAIWNHDPEKDVTVITSGGQVTVIGPQAFLELPTRFADEVLVEAKRSKAPLSVEPVTEVKVGGNKFRKPAPPVNRLLVPVSVLDKVNLQRLDRDVLLRIAACCGAVLEETATKKQAVETILTLIAATAPPAETGENQPAAVK